MTSKSTLRGPMKISQHQVVEAFQYSRLTQQGMAEILMVSRSSVQSWIYGARVMPHAKFRLFTLLTGPKPQAASHAQHVGHVGHVEPNPGQ